MDVGSKKVGLKNVSAQKSSFQASSYCSSTKILSSCPRSTKYSLMVSQQCKSKDRAVSV